MQGLSRIRELSARQVKGSIQLGQKIELPISDDKVSEFNAKRVQYHQSIEEDFDKKYFVSGVRNYRIAHGDSLELISREQKIPLWLVRKYMTVPWQNQNSLSCHSFS